MVSLATPFVTYCLCSGARIWLLPPLTLSFLIPACGVLCMLWKTRVLKIINVVLAVLIGLFNIVHAFMELPSDNAGQYIIMPMMIVVGLMLAWYSIKYVKED